MKIFKNYYVFWLVSLSVFLVLWNFNIVPAKAGSGDNLSGWAWVDPETILPLDPQGQNLDIGWISFNSTNQGGGINYGVNVASDGLMSGYAWSGGGDNPGDFLGWLSFKQSDLTECPLGTCEAKLDRATGEVSGWAKFLAADNRGWDGWVKLRGTAQNASPYGVSVSGCDWDGYAWGSDVVGWIHFKGSNYGVVGSGNACTAVSLDFTGDPTTITQGQSSTLTWFSQNADSCAASAVPASSEWSGNKAKNGNQPVTPTQTTTYTLTCAGAGGSVSKDVTITVNQPPVADAKISATNSNFTDSITVVKGVPTTIFFSASDSSDPDGWTSSDGVSSGGKCEWNSDLNQNEPIFEEASTKTDPDSPSACNTPGIPATMTFNDDLGGQPSKTITYQVLKITDNKGAVSNVDTVSVTIVEPTNPDLTADIPAFTPPQAGQSFSFPGIISNIGSGSADASNADFKLDGVALGLPAAVSSLAPGASLNIASSNWVAAGGSHTLELCADSQNSISEIFETNNCVTKTFSVPTLEVDLSAEPSSGPAPLNGVDLTALVGGTASGPITYKFDCANDGAYEYVFNDVSDNPKTVIDACDYAASGVYTAKVVAERGGAPPASATLPITVFDTPVSDGNIKVKRVGSDLTVDSAPPGTTATVGVTTKSENPADFLNISVGAQSVSFTDVSGFDEKVGTCSYNDVECSVASFPITPVCDGTACGVSATVEAGQTTKVVVKYEQIVSGFSCNSQAQCVLGGGGISCSVNANCPGSGFSCSGNQCVLGGGGASCTSSVQCGDGEGCVGNCGGGGGGGSFTCNAYGQCVLGGSGQISCTSDAVCGGGPGLSVTPSVVANSAGMNLFCSATPPNHQVDLPWTYSDPNGDPQASYKLQVDDNSDFGSMQIDTGIVDSSTHEYVTPAGVLLENQTYYWRVAVKDNTGEWSVFSNVALFNTPSCEVVCLPGKTKPYSKCQNNQCVSVVNECGATTCSNNAQCAAPLPQCSDGINNDGDAFIDYPADPGCSSASDNDERDPVFREI